MFNRFFSSVMIVTSAFTLIIGQTPEAKPEAGRGKSVQAIGFAFAGDGGYLGIQTQEVDKGNFAKFGLSNVRGVAVEKVLENSPAGAAGIQTGDVIVRFESEEITSSRKLIRLIREVAPDHQVRLTVVRGGIEQEVNVTLGRRPIPNFEEGNFGFSPRLLEKLEMPNFPAPPKAGVMPRILPVPDAQGRSFSWRGGEGRQIGIGVYSLTKQLSESYGVEGGLMINTVRENSPAAKAGLKAGDIIVEIDGKPVKQDLDLIRAISGKKEGDVQLTIIRDGGRQTFSVTPEASTGTGFIFQTEDGNEIAPPPGQLRDMTPMVPAVPLPMTVPAPMRSLRPGIVI